MNRTTRNNGRSQVRSVVGRIGDPAGILRPDRQSVPRRRRSGAILAVVLLTLLVVSLVGAALVHAIVLHDRQMRGREDQQQAFWLAESALQRAAHAAAQSPDYKGETWPVSAETLGTGRAGKVVITVEPSRAPASGRVIRVDAYYPDDEVHRTLRQRELLIQ